MTSNNALRIHRLKYQPLCYISDAYRPAALKYKVNADNDANKGPMGLSYKDDICDIVYASKIMYNFNSTGLIACI